MNETCGGHGKIVNSTGECLCDYYYDPTVNCTQNLYQLIPTYVLDTYITLACACILIICCLFGPEIAADIKFKGKKMCKQPAIILKFVGLIYSIIKLTAVIIFTVDMVNMAPTHALEVTALYFIDIVIMSFFYIVASVLWLDLLQKTKHIGFTPWYITGCKIIFIILAAVGCPASAIFVVMSTYDVGPALIGELGAYITIIYLLVPLVITIIYIIKTVLSLCKLPIDSSSSIRAVINKIKKKTIALTAADFVLIVNTINIVATFKVGTSTSGFIMFRAYFTLTIEFSLAICLWLFVRTHTPVNYIVTWVSSMSRNSVSSSTGGLSSPSGSRSARGSQSTPSTVLTGDSRPSIPVPASSSQGVTSSVATEEK